MNPIITIITAITLLSAGAQAQQTTTKTSPPPPALQVYGHYLLIQAALAGDSLNGVSAAATTITKLARDESKLPAGIATAAEKVGKAADLKSARSAFKELSDALIAHRQTDQALKDKFYLIHCSMAFDDQGASWLQATKTISNLYFGASMLRCGVVNQ